MPRVRGASAKRRKTYRFEKQALCSERASANPNSDHGQPAQQAFSEAMNQFDLLGAASG